MDDDANVIRWMHEIEDVPSKAIDPLADEVMRRFNGAVAWQSTERVNGKSLRTVLEDCWEQQNGILSCADAERARALGVDVVVNMTALKTGIANAYLTDNLTSGTSELPWVVQPTPRPDISPIARDAVREEVKARMYAGGYSTPTELIEHIRMAKQYERRKEQDLAEKSCREMTALLEDQCAEGGFTRALKDFLQYFPVYPFAVFAGPYITRAPRLVWGKNKPRVSTEVFPTFRAISPFDFCYSPDSPDTQRGTCVFTRTLWTRRELLDASKLPSFLQDNVLEVLKNAETQTDFDLHWLSHSPDSPQRNLSLWSSNVAPIEVLTHYGWMSGRELNKYNFTGLDDDEFYNCEITMAGYRVIQVRVIRDTRMSTRPIYTASFYRTGGDRIAGDGIAQRIRDVERAYLACLRFMMRNAYFASAPMCEADYTRLSQHMSDEDLGQVVPGLMYLVNPDAAHSTNPALKFFNIPANIPAYAQLLEGFMQLADRITNIPASLHGEAVGSGALRTFRGMAMLNSNATKALYAAVDNISHGVFAPLGELLYNNNMLYSSDASIKGDSHIVVKGAEGLLAREMEKQSATEILQLMGSVGAQLGSLVNVGPVVAWGIEKLLGSMQVPDDVVEAMRQAPPAMPAQGASGGSGANPNPNPSPGSPMDAGVQADLVGGAS